MSPSQIVVADASNCKTGLGVVEIVSVTVISPQHSVVTTTEISWLPAEEKVTLLTSLTVVLAV